MRARDAAGRPVPDGSPEAVEPVPEQALPPREALALARDLLDRGRPFFAHDVLEARWKAAPAQERDLWQGLAQVCVGLTHLQRGNPVGGARLLRRGAGRLQAYAGPSYDVDAAAVAGAALRRAEAVEVGEEGPGVRL
jgi:predicted metal-dependent hydrolase